MRTENLVTEFFAARVADHGTNANMIASFAADLGPNDVHGAILAEFFVWCLYYRQVSPLWLPSAHVQASSG